MRVILLILIQASLVFSLQPKNQGNDYQGFLQLSKNDSGNKSEGMDDDTKVLTVFLLNVIGCILCCAAVQGVILLSKKMNAELVNKRKNYKNYMKLLYYKNLNRDYTEEKKILADQTGNILQV